MNRIKFVASLSEDVRRRFINNVVDGNDSVDFIDRWMVSDDCTSGIIGAFVWGNTKEGHDYWKEINDNIIKQD